MLEEEMRTRYPDREAKYDVDVRTGHAAYVSFGIMERMMRPFERLEAPDPVERYNAMVASLKKHKVVSDAGVLQRHAIMRGLLAHLRALERAESQPRSQAS